MLSSPSVIAAAAAELPLPLVSPPIQRRLPTALSPEARLLADANRALVGYVLNIHFSSCSAQEREELEATGYLALCDAARRFDPGTGNTFATYAIPTIRTQILRTRWQIASNGFAATSALERGGIGVADLPQLASLDAPCPAGKSDDGASDSLSAMLPDVQERWPDATALRHSDVAEVWSTVARLLKPRQAAAVALYFAGPNGDGDGMTLEEIGGRLGVTKQRVSKLLSTSLAALRQHVTEATGQEQPLTWC